MNDDRCYERYKNWQINKARYKHESVGLVLFFGIGFFIGCKIYGFVVGTVESSEKKDETGNMSRENKKTTEVGYINKNNQKKYRENRYERYRLRTINGAK